MCEGFSLSVTDVEVQLVGSDAAALLEEAEEIEDLKVLICRGLLHAGSHSRLETCCLAQRAVDVSVLTAERRSWSVRLVWHTPSIMSSAHRSSLLVPVNRWKKFSCELIHGCDSMTGGGRAG